MAPLILEGKFRDGDAVLVDADIQGLANTPKESKITSCLASACSPRLTSVEGTEKVK